MTNRREATFVVGEPDGPRSEPWKVILREAGDVYIGIVGAMGDTEHGFKISLHASEEWAVKMTHPELVRQTGNPDSRNVERRLTEWTAPRDRFWGAKPSNVYLNFPTSELRHRGRKERDSEYAWIPAAPAGCKRQVIVYLLYPERMGEPYSEDQDVDIDLGPSSRIAAYILPTPVATLKAGGLVATVMFYDDMPVLETEVEWMEEARHADPPPPGIESGQVFVPTPSGDGRIVIWDEPGVPFIWELSL
jgi:hypothetical protein